MTKKHAVVFLAWGDKYLKEVERCVKNSPFIATYAKVLITDQDTVLDGVDVAFTEVIRATFETQGLLRKTEMARLLPDTYDAYLFLDSDTIVIEDISLGFEKAEQVGIAAAVAPHYSLDWFHAFDRYMKLEGVPCLGQLQYNTGVIFFSNSPAVKAVFQLWMELGLKYRQEYSNDQPFFTLAMEKLGFTPYTLTLCYNYRGFGDPISGLVRIWHSNGRMPRRINEHPEAWPGRMAWPSRVLVPKRAHGMLYRLIRTYHRLRDR